MKKLNLFLLVFLFLNAGKIYGQANLRKEKCLLYIKGKLPLTEENLAFLSKERINYSFFFLLRDTASMYARERINQYNEFFDKAESMHGFTKNRLRKICFVESYGRNNTFSYAGASGIMQFMPATGEEYGLVNKKNGIDYRTDPECAIFAAAKYLQNSDKIFGDADIADATYHMGSKNMCNILTAYLYDVEKKIIKVNTLNAFSVVKKYHISMEKIYFSARPGTKLYANLVKLKDSSMSYFWSLKSAGELLEMEKNEYLQKYYSYRNIFDDGVKAKARYSTHSWCIDGVECEEDLDSLGFAFNLKIPKNIYQKNQTKFTLRVLSEFQMISFVEMDDFFKIVFPVLPVDKNTIFSLFGHK